LGHGEFTRSILAILREAPKPLSVKDIAMQLSEARGLDTGTSAIQAMIDRVRGMLARQKASGVVASVKVPGDGVRWRVA
jgi:repressor of nif and glnA expression